MTDDPKYQTGEPPGPEQMAEGAIVSNDTLRSERLPPGQVRTRKWPVLHATTVPKIVLDSWSLHVFGLVEHPLRLTWDEFQALPRVKVFADFHCVTRWSRLGNLWEGVSIREFVNRTGVKPQARFVIIAGYDGDWTTNVPLEDFFSADALIADRHDGESISPDHGGPARLILPKLYAWKSAKWIKSIEFVSEDRPGYWERAGYHNHGDPWAEERFSHLVSGRRGSILKS